MIHNNTDVFSFSINNVSSELRKVAGEFDIKKVYQYIQKNRKISAEDFDAIQIPISVLDQRVFKKNIIQSF